MKRDITEILNQLVCVGPLHEIPKNIPSTARGIEKWVVATICNKLAKCIDDARSGSRFNSFYNGRHHARALLEFKEQLMAEYNITEKDLTEKAIRIERG